jgi:hypothetical protein
MAIELLMACQAIDLLHPLTSTPPLQAVHDLVRLSIRYPFLLLMLIDFYHFLLKYLGSRSIYVS